MKTRTAHGQRTLPGEFFTSSETWRLECERLFRRHWLLAGHVSQLPHNGSYFVHDCANDSVLVVRDHAGTVRAHHNFCRHRGTRLCAESRGQLAQTLRCAYHAWSYALDGTLQGAPGMQDVAGFERADWGLKPVALAQWRGFLFVNLATDADPLGEPLRTLSGKFAHWPLEELQSVQQTTYEVAANWKLIFHNFSECYHCPGAHPPLNRLTPFRNSHNDLEEGAVLGGPMTMVNPEGSMTRHGKRCALPFAGLTAEERGRVYYYTLFPSAFLSLHPDYVMLHRLCPLASDRTRVICQWYFHPQALAHPGFDPQPAIEFWDQTNREDWTLCANAFSGVCSSAWEPGPYSELESQLAAFDRHYLRMLDPERAVL